MLCKVLLINPFLINKGAFHEDGLGDRWTIGMTHVSQIRLFNGKQESVSQRCGEEAADERLVSSK